MSYAYAEGVVWLEELAVEAHPMVHDLCRTHAGAVRVPRGWELRDRWTVDAERPTDGRGVVVQQDQLDLVGA
jgi:hypothetical protein